MTAITVIAVGRPRGGVAEAVAEYEERAGRYWKLRTVEVTAGAPGRKAPPGRVRRAEAERILRRVPDGARVVALTRQGKRISSAGLARALQGAALEATHLALVIGGAFGLDPGVLERAALRWSLSELTLPHEMARLVLAEQLYRAGTIVRGEPYHKGPG